MSPNSTICFRYLVYFQKRIIRYSVFVKFSKTNLFGIQYSVHIHYLLQLCYKLTQLYHQGPEELNPGQGEGYGGGGNGVDLADGHQVEMFELTVS